MSRHLLYLAVAFGIAILASIDEYNKLFHHRSGTPPSTTSRKEREDHHIQVIPTPGRSVGPESFALDPNGGGPYTGVSDGRVVRWMANETRWVDFAVTSRERRGCGEGSESDHSAMEHVCGRPLGLGFNEGTGEMYIADAYMGLLLVGPNGGQASPIVKQVDGVALGFANSLDIDQRSGVVYFTDSSTRVPRRNYVSAIITGDSTGRLMKYDPETNETTLILKDLSFPNGVALSKDGSFLLFAETTTCKLFKYWLSTSKAGHVEVVARIPGFPDNVKRTRPGNFWVGINSRRGKMLEWVVSNPWIGRSLVRILPSEIIAGLHSILDRWIGKSGMGVRVDEDGNVVEVLDSIGGQNWKSVSEVYEGDDDRRLWIGSVVMPFAVKVGGGDSDSHTSIIV